eukprot:1160534-Pelagomonas_calceolata.AAC.33
MANMYKTAYMKWGLLKLVNIPEEKSIVLLNSSSHHELCQTLSEAKDGNGQVAQGTSHPSATHKHLGRWARMISMVLTSLFCAAKCKGVTPKLSVAPSSTCLEIIHLTTSA